MILAAALDEFSARGYRHTTLTAVAARAGVSSAALYYHFDGKLAVLAELLGGIGRSMAAALEASEPADSLRRLIVDRHTAFAQWVDTHPGEAMLWFGRSDGIAPPVEEVRRAWTTLVAGRTRDAVSALVPGIDDRTAGVIGLALPVLLEEYARLRVHDPASGRPARRRQIDGAVTAMADRLDGLARAVARSGAEAPVK